MMYDINIYTENLYLWIHYKIYITAIWTKIIANLSNEESILLDHLFTHLLLVLQRV